MADSPGSSAKQDWPAPRGAISLAALAGMGLVLGTLMQAILIGRFIDRILRGDTFFLDLIGAMIGIVAVKTALGWVARMGVFQGGAATKPRVRDAIQRQLIRLGPAGRASHRTGRIAHDAVEGVEALDSYYGLFVPQLLVGLSAPLVLCAGVGWMDMPTGLLLLATTPLAPLLLGATRSRFRSVSARYHAAAGALSAEFLDSVQGLPTLKMFNREKDHGESLRSRSEGLRRETMKLLAINQIAIFLLDWGFALGAVTAGFVMAVVRYRAGALTAGEAVAVVLITVEIVRQFNLLGAFFFAGAGGRAMIRRIREFLAREPEVPSREHPRKDAPPDPPLGIRFENVSFGYHAGEPVLKNLSFAVAPGESVALLGPSGAGKSTVAHLLLRFFDPQQGRILLGGQPISGFPLAWLRNRIAVVSQDTWLFHGTIAENLRMARRQATIGEMEAALHSAGLRDWIESLPAGIETHLGERGERLSGGQAQRIAIARAFLKDAPVLVLDEPTSHVDAATESIITTALQRLSRGRTVLHITHRSSAARTADRTLVLDRGAARDSFHPVLHPIPAA